jgi:hypothetical protein
MLAPAKTMAPPEIDLVFQLIMGNKVLDSLQNGFVSSCKT